MSIISVRELISTTADAGNRSFVTVYGHTRLQYNLSPQGFVRTVLIPSSDLIRSIMVVADLRSAEEISRFRKYS